MYSKKQRLIELSGLVLIFSALLTVLYFSKADKEENIEDVETNELSMYVGHFTPTVELRRIDDLERGASCYYVHNQVSCVYTGDFGNEEE